MYNLPCFAYEFFGAVRLGGFLHKNMKTTSYEINSMVVSVDH